MGILPIVTINFTRRDASANDRSLTIFYIHIEIKTRTLSTGFRLFVFTLHDLIIIEANMNKKFGEHGSVSYTYLAV